MDRNSVSVCLSDVVGCVFRAREGDLLKHTGHDEIPGTRHHAHARATPVYGLRSEEEKGKTAGRRERGRVDHVDRE